MSMCDEFQIASSVSMIPEELLDLEKSSMTHKQSRSVDWKRPLLSLFGELPEISEQLFQGVLEQKRILQEEIEQLSVDIEQIKKEVYEKDLERNIIKEKIVTEKQNLSQIQLPDEKELTDLLAKVCSLKEGIGKKKSELKNELDKYKRGILFYKKYLHCTVMFTSKDTLIITLDTSVKSEQEAKEYLKFSIHDNGTGFQFLEMRPKLKDEHQLVKKFNETGDTQGLIVSFWNMTKDINSRKVLSEKN